VQICESCFLGFSYVFNLLKFDVRVSNKVLHMEERIDCFFGDNDSAEEDDDGGLCVPVEEDFEEEEVYGSFADDVEGVDQVRKNLRCILALHNNVLYGIKFQRWSL